VLDLFLNLIYINKNPDICYNENKMARFIDYLQFSSREILSEQLFFDLTMRYKSIFTLNC
jgi:hypothetical protein